MQPGPQWDEMVQPAVVTMISPQGPYFSTSAFIHSISSAGNPEWVMKIRSRTMSVRPSS